MGAPGTGVGQAGVWQAGVEVDPFDDARFRLHAEAVLGFIGAPHGYFAFDAVAELGFAGIPFTVGHFTLESDADLTFSGQAWAHGDFSFEVDASFDFAGAGIHFGAFDFEGVAELDFIWIPSLCPGISAVGCATGPASVTDVFISAKASVSSRKDC